MSTAGIERLLERAHATSDASERASLALLALAETAVATTTALERIGTILDEHDLAVRISG